MSSSAPPPLTDPPLIVEALGVVLRDAREPVTVLRDVSFTVAAGETVAVLGESASGLSALLPAILGLNRANEAPRRTGTVRVRKSDAGVMVHDDVMALDPTIRAGRQLASQVRRRRDIARLRSAAGLDRDAFDPLAYPHQLTAELRQRLMFAMAAARARTLLLLDEPGSGLDAVARAAFLRDIAALRAETGVALLVLTADPATAAALASRVLVLHAGRVIETGDCASVLSRPAHPYTEALVNARCKLTANRGQRLLPATDDRPPPGPYLGASNTGCAFRGPCPAGTTRCGQLPPLGPAVLHAGQVACWNVTSPNRHAQQPARWPALPPPGVAPVLVLDGIAYRYPASRPASHGGRKLALQDIALRLNERDAVAIAGGEGAGKSTLLRIAAGLLAPTQGRRAYPGTDLPQMIYRDPMAALPPWRSVGDIVGERLRIGTLSSAERATRIEEALALAQLPPEIADLRPASLTPGQAQRVGIARALIVPPALLLCDEPLAMLDPRAAASVLNLLAGLRRTQRMAILFATDDLPAARYLTDRIVVLSEGRIVEDGPAERVAAAPQSPMAQAMFALAAAP